jgi:cytidylate kinase
MAPGTCADYGDLNAIEIAIDGLSGRDWCSVCFGCAKKIDPVLIDGVMHEAMYLMELEDQITPTEAIKQAYAKADVGAA